LATAERDAAIVKNEVLSAERDAAARQLEAVASTTEKSWSGSLCHISSILSVVKISALYFSYIM
jgi:hypothetical protein